ncbi:YncE family protein, partial [Pseudomonas spelaei]
VLRYTVLRNGNTIPSEDQTVRFNTIAAANLPQPLINGLASGQILDLNTFTGNARTTLAKWRLSVTGQRVWLVVEVPGQTYTPLFYDYPISASEAQSGLAKNEPLRSWLAGLPNNTRIEVKCQVTFDGSQDPGRVVIFPITTYTVVHALQIDQSVMNLNGRAITVPARWNWIRSGDYSGNAQTRTVTGGVPPYTYSSRSTEVSVTATGGKVTGMSNGSTFIDVKDSAGNVVSYPVVVSNVWQLREYDSGLNWAQAVAWRKTLPGSQGIYFADGIRLMGDAYGWPIPVPPDAYYWLCVEEGCDSLTGVHWEVIKPNQVRCVHRGTIMWAWCLQP